MISIWRHSRSLLLQDRIIKRQAKWGVEQRLLIWGPIRQSILITTTEFKSQPRTSWPSKPANFKSPFGKVAAICRTGPRSNTINIGGRSENKRLKRQSIRDETSRHALLISLGECNLPSRNDAAQVFICWCSRCFGIVNEVQLQKSNFNKFKERQDNLNETKCFKGMCETCSRCIELTKYIASI